jgi:hypothetical protein
MAPRVFRVLRSVAAGVLALAAVNHVVLAARGVGEVPRHVVFVLVNAGLAAVVLQRPRWALPAAMLVALQQVPSHGEDLVASLGSQLDWASLGVVLFFPALIMLLAVERTASRPGPPRAAPRGP